MASEISLPFYDHNPHPIETHIFADQPTTSTKRSHFSRDDLLRQFIEQKDWDIEDARDLTRRLGIDLQREPRYSRQMFDRLLVHPTKDIAQVVQFLDDPYMNTRGSGNYLAAVQSIITKTKRANRIAVINAVVHALELGLVPTDEICQIVKALPEIVVERNKTLAEWDRKTLLKHYRAMWKAIGRCHILGHNDLDKSIVDAWLEELLNIGSFRFAAEVIAATHSVNSDTRWPSRLILSCLEATSGVDTESNIPRNLLHISALLNFLEPDYAAKCILEATELLSLFPRDQQERLRLLEHWQDCLLNVSDITAIANSRIWLDVPIAPAHVSERDQTAVSFSRQQDIVLRMWALRTLSRSQGPMYNQNSRVTDKPIYLLLDLYQSTIESPSGSFLAELMHGIHSLDLPYNNLLMLAVDLKLRKLTTKATRRTLAQLETSQTCLADVWAKPNVYNGVRHLFYGAFEQMFRSLDLTSPETVQECLRLARVGDSKSVWSILRLLRNHTPLKLCLSRAWVPIPHPDEKALVRYHPGPRDSQCPDPHAAVDFIHQLAIAFSCCQRLTPPRSFHLVHWLYDYLRRHGGPVHPSLVRAMYHAGVVRYRREGRRVAATQYEYIMWIIRKFEGPEVAEQLTAPPQVGRSRSRKSPNV